MPLKSLRSPRKKPVQERSQITVEAILDAATRIFNEAGFDRATTNRVAELAGVSVGSLYQYFPNKLSLLTAVRDTTQRNFFKEMIAACNRGCEQAFEPAVRGIAETSAAFHGRHAALFRIFSAELPATARGASSSVQQLDYHEAQKRFFEAHAAHISIPREQALFFTRNAGSAIMQAAVMNHPDKLHDGSIAAQLTTAFIAYLSHGDAATPRTE
jgi:AcrR family transcriptional regulator